MDTTIWRMAELEAAHALLQLHSSHMPIKQIYESQSDWSETSKETDDTDDSFSEPHPKKVTVRRAAPSRGDDVVRFGDGRTAVPLRVWRGINWTSYTSATRKLLAAVFSRKTLATCSLTGKPSPAFPDRPAKARLDPVIVNDIVVTVVRRCRVPESVVRTSITVKCADESKMLRNRLMKERKNKNLMSNSLP